MRIDLLRVISIDRVYYASCCRTMREGSHISPRIAKEVNLSTKPNAQKLIKNAKILFKF
jgi:hypothetical protein